MKKMKKSIIGMVVLLLLTFNFLTLRTSFSQNNVGINTTGAVPNSSAILDLNTGNTFTSPNGKGLLIPNVALASTADVTTITSPATSLVIYNTNAGMTNGNGAGYYYWSGSQWIYMAAPSNGPGTSGQVLTSQGSGSQPQWLATSGGGVSNAGTGIIITGAGTVATPYVISDSVHKIGDTYGGGIVFYVYDNGRHGLIAATADQSTGVVWTTAAYQSTVSNAVRDEVNGGQTNTERIIIQAGAGSYAAQLCANYQGGNYGDWYLPSKYELNLLYLQKAVVGGFSTINYYWSSTENNNSSAWAQYFYSGLQNLYNKNYSTYYVRAVRAF